MDAAYWHKKWSQNEIGFHQTDFNPLMVAHFGGLDLRDGAHVFVPLCGKTRDIAWLLDEGFRVTGAELSQTAVEELFAELDLTPVVTQDGALLRFATPELVVFVGDIFDVTQHAVGAVDAVYDRAALVALPADLRERYAQHLIAITEGAAQFVLTFTYDQSIMNGPPFSITADMIVDLYDQHYALKLVDERAVPGNGLKGRTPATEVAWQLLSF